MTKEKFANILTAMDFEKLTDRMFKYASGSVGNGVSILISVDSIRGFHNNYHIGIRRWGLSQWFDPDGNCYEHEYDNDYEINCDSAGHAIRAITEEIWR